MKAKPYFLYIEWSPEYNSGRPYDIWWYGTVDEAVTDTEMLIADGEFSDEYPRADHVVLYQLTVQEDFRKVVGYQPKETRGAIFARLRIVEKSLDKAKNGA